MLMEHAGEIAGRRRNGRRRSRERCHLDPGSGRRAAGLKRDQVEGIGRSGRKSADRGRGRAGGIRGHTHRLAILQLVQVIAQRAGRGGPTQSDLRAGRSRAGEIPWRGRGAGRRRCRARRTNADQVRDQLIGNRRATPRGQIVARRGGKEECRASRHIVEIGSRRGVDGRNCLGWSVERAEPGERPALIGDCQ